MSDGNPEAEVAVDPPPAEATEASEAGVETEAVAQPEVTIDVAEAAQGDGGVDEEVRSETETNVEGDATDTEAPSEVGSEQPEGIPEIEEEEVEDKKEVEGEKQEEEENEEVEDKEEDKGKRREELIEKYEQAVKVREELNTRSANAQHKIASLMIQKRRGGADDESSSMSAPPRDAAHDQEGSYVKALGVLDELREKSCLERNHYNQLIDEIRQLMKEKEMYAELEAKKASDYRARICGRATFSRSGRAIATEQLNEMDRNEKRKEGEVSQARLENIKLRNSVSKLEAALRKREQLAEGLHLIDFEQLKIENQTYNEKIEERNEELIKLRKKITSTVQVLTHLKEKLESIEANNSKQKLELHKVETQVAAKRDHINGIKRSRDRYRRHNDTIVVKGGLLGRNELLEDYEVCDDIRTGLLNQIEKLKLQHAELGLKVKGVKQKISHVATTKPFAQ